MAKHTPGPWAVYRNWQGKLSVAADGGKRRICNTPGGNNANADLMVEGTANARLIAAAPDMLEALKRTANFFGYVRKDTPRGQLVEIVLAAITKAEGN